ncbi:DUF4391 domain-containing protein [Rhodoferax antarcticus]|uniref:DUF4391 domain-containing protein n=1 Tax=Rhodoferax antarcticus ANT.BR TaxID=1111071 RepID=A0A1Q8YBU0_9BURK|nr:DUF4391 domain-containing protein [Rhodoferax antarcticus]APW46662.1 hypothetical protein RA876_10110 [Rhodoferax antarcticus]OLP05551.1 hypothetical protein BLL52_3219 [Rhodoferax antarcticus ANT.BR]
MTPEALIAALALPQQAMVNQRVAKKLLLDSGSPTAADKRLIQDSIEDLFWIAALKPEAIGVPAYRDDTREYLELAVLSATLRSAATPRLAELVHRAIPYPVLLVMAAPSAGSTTQAPCITVSLAHIRWAQREVDRTVLDGSVVQAAVGEDAIGTAFTQALALQRQPRTHMLDLYQGWIDTTTALQAAALTGQFTTSPNREAAAIRRTALHQCHDLKAHIAQLRTQASKEKQLPRQVAQNLQIRTAKATLDQLLASLSRPLA